MRILLTNDDGIEARGLAALLDVFSERHEVYCIAPDRERSGCSNAFTIDRSMRLKRHGENRYSLDGYPSDCVNVGLHAGIIPDVDLVISGINHGPNLGDDIFFSGTVAGARMAFIFDKPGIALSLNTRDNESPFFDDAARFLLSCIEDASLLYDGPAVLNINYPALPGSEIAGIRSGKTCRRKYRDHYERRIITGDEIQLTLRGNIDAVREEGTDFLLLDRGYIVITPLTIDCNDYDAIKRRGYVSRQAQCIDLEN